MIVLVFILNLVVSTINAWGCGKSWTETRVAGGIPHALNWCGAIMAACGFTWCYLVLIGAFGATVEFEQDDGTMATYLSPEQLEAFANLGYMTIVGPILGSGLAITVHAWRVAWERRTIGSGAIAAYDTFAMVYNFQSAFEHVPEATSQLRGFFSSDDDNGKGKVVLLVVLAALAGVVTTYLIISRTAKSTATNRSLRLQNQLS